MTRVAQFAMWGEVAAWFEMGLVQWKAGNAAAKSAVI